MSPDPEVKESRRMRGAVQSASHCVCMRKQKSGLHELIIYCLIGCVGATLDFIIFVSLEKTTAIHYQAANFIGVSAGIINNFFLNRHFNFKTHDRVFSRFACFYLVGMLGCAISAGCLWLLVEQLRIGTVLAKIETIAIVTTVQFCLNKFVTFRKSRS